MNRPGASPAPPASGRALRARLGVFVKRHSSHGAHVRALRSRLSTWTAREARARCPIAATHDDFDPLARSGAGHGGCRQNAGVPPTATARNPSRRRPRLLGEEVVERKILRAAGAQIGEKHLGAQ